jgi:hypothetical protein
MRSRGTVGMTFPEVPGVQGLLIRGIGSGWQGLGGGAGPDCLHIGTGKIDVRGLVRQEAA